jgi:hypothetical protein
MATYIIEVRNSSGQAQFTEALDGPEVAARQRAAELVETLKAASAHVFDAKDRRELYRIAEKI